MNVNDSEVVAAIMQQQGFELIDNIAGADIILINTYYRSGKCRAAVKSHVIDVFRQMKKKNPLLKIGIIGCMAERLKEKLLEEEKSVDLIVGPDAYRDLPHLVKATGAGQKAINVILSHEETYTYKNPVRLE